jgi:signal peptide peptidase SppA
MFAALFTTTPSYIKVAMSVIGAIALISRLVKKKSSKTVAAVRLNGIIGTGKTAELSYESTYKRIHEAFKVPNAAAVALLINSPGGSPTQSYEIYSYIRENAKKYKVPVYAFIEDVGASGGYFIACAADHIYASPTSIVGSIGVISSGFGLKGLIEKLGIERRVYTQGTNKSILDPFSEEKASDIEILKGIQKECHDEFISIVKESRKEKLAEENPDIFTGLFWLGRKAKELGLVDEIGSHYSSLKTIFGEDVDIKYIKGKQSTVEMLRDLVGTQTAAETVVHTAITQLKTEISLNRFSL